MDALIALLHTLNSLSPLGIIGLGLVIFLLVKNERRVQKIETNDLHELPEMMATLRSIQETLQRMEVSLGENFSYIRARLNGGK